VWLLLQLSQPPTASAVTFSLNGVDVAVEDVTNLSLLDALREQLGCRSVKDGCSPQGQCGCCTVWVDGAPRVACVTAVRRVAGRHVTTVEGMPADQRARWTRAFADAGASQCGFCTPGILLRLAALESKGQLASRTAVESALLAHLCRCTGWQPIVDAACAVLARPDEDTASDSTPDSAAADDATAPTLSPADLALRAAWRAGLEGGTMQSWGTDVVVGGGGFADDVAPPDSVIQLGADGDAAAGTLQAARAASGKVQGRNSTVPLTHPVALPPGEWALMLQTTWTEPAYLEPDASWCRPGDAPASPLANGGAFGGKHRSPVASHAAALAGEHGRPVRVLWTREDVVRHGPKRPPVALGLRADGSGVVRVGITDAPGVSGDDDESGDTLAPVRALLNVLAPGIELEVAPITGPPVGTELRGAGWVEVVAALHALRASGEEGASTTPGFGAATITLPGGGRAAVEVRAGVSESDEPEVSVEVWAGDPLHAATLRSYVTGAVHQALGLVWSEGIAVDGDGVPVDLTIRSFGILTARDMPRVTVRVHDDDRWPVNVSDAVFAATVAAAHAAEGAPAHWPTRRVAGSRRSAVPPSGPAAAGTGRADVVVDVMDVADAGEAGGREEGA
jgi:aerobic-type carbon monoxide dehydrogenase small subunit (CoxS/CutS family)